MPFLDSRLVDYMCEMPESWGRGLELRPTKYPLRTLATERWGMPLHILEESGPHSYIAENDKRWTYSGGQWDIYCEILFKSVFSPVFRDQLTNVLKIEDTFDPALFDNEGNATHVDQYAGGSDAPEQRGLHCSNLLCSRPSWNCRQHRTKRLSNRQPDSQAPRHHRIV